MVRFRFHQKSDCHDRRCLLVFLENARCIFVFSLEIQHRPTIILYVQNLHIRFCTFVIQIWRNSSNRRRTRFRLRLARALNSGVYHPLVYHPLVFTGWEMAPISIPMPIHFSCRAKGISYLAKQNSVIKLITLVSLKISRPNGWANQRVLLFMVCSHFITSNWLLKLTCDNNGLDFDQLVENWLNVQVVTACPSIYES